MFGIFSDAYAVNPYAPILVFLVATGITCFAFFILPSFLASKEPSRGKTLPYECGIDVDDAEITQFDVRFYLVAMLFLVFDCEVIFLFPWSLIIKNIAPCGFLAAISFLFVLTVGLIYEWRKGSLDW